MGPGQAKLFHVDGRTHDTMTQLTDAFHNFAHI
jgi:hypothetical protein